MIDLSNATNEELAELERLFGLVDRGPYAAEWERCANNIAYWFNTYVWTYNPKLSTGERWIKFELFPRQREFLSWLKDREDACEDGLVEKSRDVGMTWLNIAYLVHQWLFTSDFKGAVGSRKEDLVDKIGDPDSILEKGRLLLQRLPTWMLPKGFDTKKHCGYLKFINPENNSVITGESGDNIGRGGRNSVYFLDEAAFIDHADRVEAALSQNCDVVIWVSTVNGVGNNFYSKRFGGVCPVFIFDWRDDPRKSQAWYDAQKARFAHNPALMAAEVDRDYTASIEGVVIPGVWVQAAVDAHLKLGWVPSGGTYAAADIAAGGANRTVFGARTQSVVSGLRESSEPNTTLTARNLRDWTRECKASILSYDAVGLGIGVRSTFDLEEHLGFRTNAIVGGASPSELRWPDGKASKEMFQNLRAELCWMLRLRFQRTYEAVEGITTKWNPEDLISIPFHPKLIADLSMPLQKPTSTGKIRIESKDEMRSRGITSPDWFDMLIYLFAPSRPTTIMTRSETSIDLDPSPHHSMSNAGTVDGHGRMRVPDTNSVQVYNVFG